MLYILKIKDPYMEIEKEYLVNGNINKLTNIINSHYKMVLLSNNTTANLISRQKITSKKYENISIFKIRHSMPYKKVNKEIKKKQIYNKKVEPLPICYSIY